MRIARVLSLVALLGLLVLLIFTPGWSGGVLSTTDDNIGHLAERVAAFPFSFRGGWQQSPLAGMSSDSYLGWINLNLWLLPLRFSANWLHAMTLVASSLFFAGFLSSRRCHWAGCLLGVVTALWVGSNCTLIFAGHIGKFGVMLFSAAALFCAGKTEETRRIPWAVLTGGALGFMFVEQQDLALFMAFMLGPFLLFSLRCSNRKQYGKDLLRLFLPALCVALVIASYALLSGYQSSIQGVSTVQESQQAKWEFCTQWSWPPEESIDFIAPGYTGWRSGEPDGPYWGRMGRSAGWELTRQGFMNFKLENTYLGFIPVAFALFALFSCRRSPHRAEILFWGGAALVALLLAFGKYFPLYRIFWQLPVVNSIRNPNKFLQVFQLCLAILTAYGVGALFGAGSREQGIRGRGELKVESRKSTQTDLRLPASDRCLLTSEVRRFFWLAAGALGVLSLWALSLTLNRNSDIAGFMSQGWPQQMAQVIVKNKITALWHASFMAAVTVAIFAVFSFPTLGQLLRFKSWLASGLVLIVAADAAYLSRHYVKTLPSGYIEENEVTRLLKEQLGHQRTAMVTQDGFYNLWLTYLFPYHQIPAFNITQMPRMPQDYKQFLETLSRNPLRMWQLSGVGFLLGPAGISQQFPAGSYETILRYDVFGASDGSLSVKAGEQGGQAVFRSAEPAPRYALIGGCEKMSDAEALIRLADPARNPFEKIILPPESTVTDPGGRGFCGEAEVLEYRPGRVLLKVQADVPGFLRAADKYDPDWKAFVNGEPAELLRADFIFQAVHIPAGVHEVELKYSPENKLLWLQFVGMAVCFVAGITLFFKRKQGR